MEKNNNALSLFDKFDEALEQSDKLYTKLISHQFQGEMRIERFEKLIYPTAELEVKYYIKGSYHSKEAMLEDKMFLQTLGEDNYKLFQFFTPMVPNRPFEVKITVLDPINQYSTLTFDKDVIYFIVIVPRLFGAVDEYYDLFMKRKK